MLQETMATDSKNHFQIELTAERIMSHDHWQQVPGCTTGGNKTG